MVLSERKAKDREHMVKLLANIASKHGATLERTECLCDGKQIYFYIHAHRGLSVSIDFSGDSPQADTHVVAWHFRDRGDTRLSELFGMVAGGSVNSIHRHKCTAVQYGFDALQASIDKCLAMANDGSAFIESKQA